MPNCFNLTRKSAPEAGPVPRVTIDEEMCAFFGLPCDPVKWHHGWHDDIGFGLALGESLEKQRADTLKKIDGMIGIGNEDGALWQGHKLEIINWLDAHFTTNAWATIGK